MAESHPSERAVDRQDQWGLIMLSTTTDQKLHLTAELRAVDGGASKSLPKMTTTIFASEIRRFPPIEDVFAALDRVAKRAFAA